jgi:response regulator RpfG family c-di-GMP phosphodiesterase
MKLTNKKKITNFILLDDDPWALQFAKEIIRGYSRQAEVKSFLCAKDALEYLRTEEFMTREADTVLLTDLHMPEIDGFALLDVMEKEFGPVRERLHIFVLSSAACPEEIKKVGSYNCAIGFINKPFSGDKLGRIMECILF